MGSSYVTRHAKKKSLRSDATKFSKNESISRDGPINLLSLKTIISRGGNIKLLTPEKEAIFKDGPLQLSDLEIVFDPVWHLTNARQ